MKMKNMTPPPGKSLLYIYRNAIFAGSGVLSEIFVDGNPVGKLAESTYLAVLLESGKHRVHDGNPQSLVPINIEAGKKYYVKVSAAASPFIVSEDDARKAMADYKLIDESEEPIQIMSAKTKSTNVAGTLSTEPVPAITVRSDIDELPAIKTKRNKNAYAIVIGIEQYRQKLPKADFATQDASLVADYLIKAMGYPEENVVLLTNDKALQSDLTKYFEKWLGNNVEKDSTVFIYYSGHGAPDTKTGWAYLVPYDGDPSFITETGYSLKRMYDALGKLPAKEIIVALDSCFSGAGGRSVIAKGARPLVMNLQSNVSLPGNMTVLSASSGEQISSTYDEKGHGLFTYFMLKGFKNEDVVNPDGSIKMDDLFGYIKPQIERIARKQYNNEQTPQLIGAKKD
ncbi:MAG: caspase family protein [Desulfobacterales bacterium]|nr:caspase family protein [Desulfobacterales bacterium]